LQKSEIEKRYRYYVADCLWGISRGKGPESRFKDLLTLQPEETRTGEEVIESIKRKLKEMG